MDMNRALGIAVLALAMVAMSAAHIQYIAAHPHPEATTTYVLLGGDMALERTQLTMSIAADNTMPWAFVEGTVSNHVEHHPVIVKIDGADGDPARYAQVDVADDGSYEYRFRVLSVDDGQVIRAFEGDYDVTIFKVVYIDTDHAHA